MDCIAIDVKQLNSAGKNPHVDNNCPRTKLGYCRSKLHDDESSMSQVVLIMTKSPKEPKRMISRMCQQIQDQD